MLFAGRLVSDLSSDYSQCLLISYNSSMSISRVEFSETRLVTVQDTVVCQECLGLIMNYFLKKLLGSNLDTFLNSGFSLATLQESGTDDSEIEIEIEISDGFGQYFGTILKENSR